MFEGVTFFPKCSLAHKLASFIVSKLSIFLAGPDFIGHSASFGKDSCGPGTTAWPVIYNAGVFDAQDFWRRRRPLNYALLPLAAVFASAAALRRGAYRWRLLRSWKVGAPVVVVGNVVVGGGGKTPLVIALTQALLERGYRPGVVSRGTGGSAAQAPFLVAESEDWRRCGDEPLLIRRKTGAPVCVCRRRWRAAERLVAEGCDVVVSDDGLQHYALRRDVEVCVSHADYREGNAWFLPAGPLRESRRRCARCDFHVLSGGGGEVAEVRGDAVYAPLVVDGVCPLGRPGEWCSPDEFRHRSVLALCGVAHPSHFFASLEKAGLGGFASCVLPDHGALSAERLARMRADAIVMTEKDAVKYSASDERLYALAVRTVLPDAFLSDLTKLLDAASS